MSPSRRPGNARAPRAFEFCVCNGVRISPDAMPRTAPMARRRDGDIAPYRNGTAQRGVRPRDRTTGLMRFGAVKPRHWPPGLPARASITPAWCARILPGRRDRDIAPYRHYSREFRIRIIRTMRCAAWNPALHACAPLSRATPPPRALPPLHPRMASRAIARAPLRAPPPRPVAVSPAAPRCGRAQCLAAGPPGPRPLPPPTHTPL